MLPGNTASSYILIVDDDEVTRRLVRNILKGAGYTVGEAGSVPAALQMASVNAPHLIILDLLLPEMDGFAFLEKRRLDPKLALIPVVVLSGVRNIEDAHRAVAGGADEYLCKPIVASLLLQKTRKRLRDRQFLSKDFGSASPLVTVTLPASVFAVNTSLCAVAVSARVAPEGDGIRLRGWDLLARIGGNFEQLKRSRQQARSIGPARYQSTFNLVGLTREQTEQLTALLEGRT